MLRANLIINYLIQIQTPLIARASCVIGFCHRFDPLHHVLMPRRAASSAAPAAAPAIFTRNSPIHTSLFEGDSDDGNHNEPLAAVLISPVKARAAKRGIANKSDLEVWDLPDSEIIGM